MVPRPTAPVKKMSQRLALTKRVFLRSLAICLLLLLFVLPQFAQACPTCKDGLSNDPQTANIARSYYWSIIFMMSMPFLILSGLGGYFYLEIVKARRLQESKAPLPVGGESGA